MHRAQNGARLRAKITVRGAENERRKARKLPDVSQWGAPPQGATRFSLNRHLPGGSSDRLGLNGADGTVKYNWPVHLLGVDWIRDRWGVGRFQANWLVDDEGKLVPRGKSRVVDIIGGATVPRARAREAPAPAFGAEPNGFHPSAAPLPPQTMPPEVVDMRVRAANEIAELRIRAEREIHAERLQLERERNDARFESLEARINEATGRRRDDDDDDEPDEWAWLKDLAQKLAPSLEAMLPELLKRFGPKGLPG